MSECLVTTLKESVADNGLLKLGDAAFDVLPVGNAPISAVGFGYTSPSEITISVEAPGYITDAYGVSNLGQSVTVSGNGNVYLSKNGPYKAKVSNKYSITRLTLFNQNNDVWGGPATTVSFPSESFYAMDKLTNLTLSANNNKYTLKEFNDLPLTYLNIISGKGKTTGDLSDLSDVNISDLDLRGNKQITGRLEDLSHMTSLTACKLSIPLITGNISTLADRPMTSITLDGSSEVTGNLSSLSNMTSLTYLGLSSTKVTGDTSSLRNLTNLTTFNYANTAITGTWPLT